MSRLRVQELKRGGWDEGLRRVVDEALRSLRSVLDGGFQWREQVRGTVDVVIDTAKLPLAIKLPKGITNPIAVIILRAVIQRSTNGYTVTSGRVGWRVREGLLYIDLTPDLAAATRYNATIAVME